MIALKKINTHIYYPCPYPIKRVNDGLLALLGNENFE
jgi:hypothetical protein